MAAILAENLHVTYPVYEGRKMRSVAALSDVGFQLASGDRLGLVGGNGAGKTTLLRTLASIIAPQSGRLEITGGVQSLMEMGLGVNGSATGRENIRLRLLAEGLSWREAEAAIEPIGAYSELGDYLDMPVDTYSRGMQLRLSFSVATSLGAEILIMDEWVGAGDATFREKATRRMHEMVEEAGIVVLASHNNVLLKRICNKGLWLEKGRVMAMGDIDSVVEAYEASLIGDGAVRPASARPARA